MFKHYIQIYIYIYIYIYMYIYIYIYVYIYMYVYVLRIHIYIWHPPPPLTYVFSLLSLLLRWELHRALGWVHSVLGFGFRVSGRDFEGFGSRKKLQKKLGFTNIF